MRTIPETLAHYALSDTHAEKLCVADSKGSLTYMQLWMRVCRFARYLKNKYPKDKCVLIQCTQDISYVISFLAVQTAGLIAVPVEAVATPEHIIQISKELPDAVYIGTDDAPEGLTAIKYDAASIDYAVFPADSSEDDYFKYFPLVSTDVAEILFTTGSTGESKGILITHENNIAVAQNIMYGLEMKENNTELIPLPLSHSHGLRTLYANLLRGCAVVLSDGIFRMKQFFSLIDEYRVTALDLSPALLSVLLKMSGDYIGYYKEQIDYVEIGTAPLSEENKEALCRLLPDSRLYNFYGSTESGRTCTYDFNHIRRGTGCIGKPTHNAVFLFVDENKMPVKATKETPGFIATGGSQNMKEYLNASELTSMVMQDGIIYTTDLGFRDEDGFIYCLGRQDFVINRGGIKISPEEIEEVALRFDGVEDCACVPVPDDIVGQVPVLFVSSSKALEDFPIKGLAAYLKDHLDVNRQPKKIELLDRIPRAKNGKILRAELILTFQRDIG